MSRFTDNYLSYILNFFGKAEALLGSGNAVDYRHSVEPVKPRTDFIYVTYYVPIRSRMTKIMDFLRPMLPGMRSLKIVAATLVFIGVVKLYFRNRVMGGYWSSRLINLLKFPVAIGSSDLRGIVSRISVIEPKTEINHTHAVCSKDRNAGTTTAIRCSLALGLDPYFIQMSKTNDRHGHAGSKTWFWGKDLDTPTRNFSFDPSKQAGILIDVDQYLDMNLLLAQYPGTYFLYTFTPTKPAKSDGDYAFNCDSDGVFHYRVSGGADFHHPVWDYSHDTICVRSLTHMVIYHIDRKYVDEHHSFLTLCVIADIYWPKILPSTWLVSDDELRRLDPVRGNFRVLDKMGPNGLVRSLSLENTFSSVDVPMFKMDRVVAVAKAASTTVTQSMVASHLANTSEEGFPTEKIALGDAAVVALYLRQEHKQPSTVAEIEPMHEVAFSVQSLGERPVLEPFGTPLINPAYVPMDDIWTERACIDGRLTKFQRNPDVKKEPDNYMMNCITKFVKLLVPEDLVGTVYPLTTPEVSDRQPRPSQQMLLAQSENYATRKPLINSFTKAESYQKPTEARNISTMQPEVKRDYSCYVYAFADEVMGKQAFYAFNKTPVEIALRVAELASKAKVCLDSDGSRWDGHVSRIMRELERAVMMRSFATEHHSELSDLMNRQFKTQGYTKHGMPYQVGYSRGSGSPETASFNSIGAAFIEYLAKTSIHGLDNITLADLGLHGGDDSLTFDLPLLALVNAAKSVGQEYEVNLIERGQLGVNFLNRYYSPEVWDGCPDSVCQVKRALGKLFLGPKNLKKPVKRLQERLRGYYLSDRYTPILGNLATLSDSLWKAPSIAAVSAILDTRTVADRFGWWATYGDSVQWPNTYGDWMEDYIEQWLPDFDRVKFNAWLSEISISNDEDLLLTAPLCEPPSVPLPTKVKCFVDGTLTEPLPAFSVANGKFTLCQPVLSYRDEAKQTQSAPMVNPLSEPEMIDVSVFEKDKGEATSANADTQPQSAISFSSSSTKPRKTPMVGREFATCGKVVFDFEPPGQVGEPHATPSKQAIQLTEPATVKSGGPTSRPKLYKGRDPVVAARNAEYIKNWDNAHAGAGTK